MRRVPAGLVAAGLLVVDKDACVLYELYAADWNGGQPTAGSGAIWDLRSNAPRPPGWTSADAAGVPILPGLLRRDEVAGGTVDDGAGPGPGVRLYDHDRRLRHGRRPRPDGAGEGIAALVARHSRRPRPGGRNRVTQESGQETETGGLRPTRTG